MRAICKLLIGRHYLKEIRTMDAKKPIFLRDYLNKQTIQIDDEAENEPEAEAICPACNNQGMLLEELEAGVLGEKAPIYRTIACPYCEKGQECTRRIWENRLKDSQLPDTYAQADLKSWGDPKHPSRLGKAKAYLACCAMFEHPKHHLSSHAVADKALRLYQDKSPDWVAKTLNERDRDLFGLMLWGDYGVGKTWLAAATLNDLIAIKQFGLYMRMSELMQSLRDSWKGDEKTSDLLERYCKAPILFIDDMSNGSEDNTPLPEYQQEYAAAIMRSRMGNELPTLVTSNWDRDRFASKWGRVCTEVMLEKLGWIQMKGRMRDVSPALGE
jgi:hypothetical protein